MKLVIVVLIMLLFSLQYKLWAGEGSFVDAWHLSQKIDLQKQENALLKKRNQILDAEVTDLKQGIKAIEERARLELGMIKEGEIFYQVIK